MRRLLVICVILVSGHVFGQDKKAIVKDSIANRDTFNISKPVSAELLIYLNKPYNTDHAVAATGTMVLACGRVTGKKQYWHGAKKSFMLFFSCAKDKSAFVVFNCKNTKGSSKEDETIEVFSSVHEPEFGKNDFIGQSSAAVIKRFGDTYIKKNGYIVYTDYNGKLLILYAPTGKVTFYRYVWLNKPVKMFSDIDKDVLKLK